MAFSDAVYPVIVHVYPPGECGAQTRVVEMLCQVRFNNGNQLAIVAEGVGIQIGTNQCLAMRAIDFVFKISRTTRGGIQQKQLGNQQVVVGYDVLG